MLWWAILVQIFQGVFDMYDGRNFRLKLLKIWIAFQIIISFVASGLAELLLLVYSFRGTRKRSPAVYMGEENISPLYHWDYLLELSLVHCSSVGIADHLMNEWSTSLLRLKMVTFQITNRKGQKLIFVICLGKWRLVVMDATLKLTLFSLDREHNFPNKILNLTNSFLVLDIVTEWCRIRAIFYIVKFTCHVHPPLIRH